MTDDLLNFTADKARAMTEADALFQAALLDVLGRVKAQAALAGAEREITRAWSDSESYRAFRNAMSAHLEGMGYTVGGDAYHLRVEW